MTSLVTGGAGFIGSHLVDRLINSGERVVILDNLSSGSVANLAAAISSGRASFIFGDCAQNVDALREYLRAATVTEMDTIYHLASPASPEAYGAHPWETLAVNSLGTMSLIELALDYRARFVFASTSEVYGDPLVHPQPEHYFGNVDTVGPRSCYDEGKRFGEAAVAAAVAARGLDARIVRFFNCYGPRMQRGDGRLIPALIDAALAGRPLPLQGSGLQTRSLTFVRDALDLLLLVARLEQQRLQPINIGDDDERTVADIARTFSRIAGIPYAVEYAPSRPGDPQRRRPDITLARSLGWTPSTDIESGLRETLAWFAASRLALA